MFKKIFEYLYILNYRIKFLIKKNFYNSNKKQFFILEKIIKLSCQESITLKKFLIKSKIELPIKIFDKKLLTLFFLKEKSIKKKIPVISLNNNDEYEKLYFYFKLLILKGWLSESYKVREYLVNYNLKKNKYIIEKINKTKKKYSQNYFKKMQKFIIYDKDLISIIKNKNIAIIGPANNDEKNASEIDKFDVVVRINQLSKENLNLRKGYKTDIVFLNGVKCDQAILENKLKFIKKTKILYVKNNGYLNFFKKIGFKNIKISSNIDDYMALGISNMLPFILFEILKYNPKKIKIFDNDLMLNPKRIKNYQRHSNYKAKDFLKMSINHDPISQFNFVKYLFKNSKIITGDKYFLSAIQHNEISYLKKLEKNYRLKT